MLKDFALEQNLSKIQRALETTVKTLASQISMITCWEPFKQALQESIVWIQNERNLTNLPAIEHFLTENSIQIGCSKIQE